MPSSVVFVLLDTTRADHFGAWGYPRDTTPTLDALAGRGVRFARHYANSHATRPSMPQLMSGRYYRDNILAAFERDANPREMSFTRQDPTVTLLPAILRDAGYATIGLSAHTWVSPDSSFGRDFDRLELLPFSPHEAHGDARPLIDRAIALWRARDRGRPLFLYLHFMDMHIPRRLPEGEPRYPVPAYDWHTRFRPNGEPEFGRHRRAWSRYDARDFTDADRAHYAAVYDTRLRYTDEQLARLLATIEADDPGLRHTLIVVTADHGEQLGEDGRIEHSPSLADGVQHVPLIMAGSIVAPGQRCHGFTEHVDLVPTIVGALGIEIPPAIDVDGTSRLGGDGRLGKRCGGVAAYYAWESYRGVRAGHYLLAEHTPGTLAARCNGLSHVYRVDGERREELQGPEAARRTTRLHRLLERRLARREREYLAGRYGPPAVPFSVSSEYWRIEPVGPAPRCAPVDEETPQATLVAPGWFWTGRGLAVVTPPAGDTTVSVAVPPGRYEVEAATRSIEPPPWLFGRHRWRRRSFGRDRPTSFVPLGLAETASGALHVRLPGPGLARRHVLGLRLAPPGAAGPASRPVDPEQEERLRALGYVQ